MTVPAAGVDGVGASDSPIGRFLAESEEHIQDLLMTHGIPPEDTADLLHEALSMLVYRWGELGDPRAWLSAMLGAHCQRYWRRRGATTPAPGGGGSPGASAGSAAPGAAVLAFEPPETP